MKLDLACGQIKEPGFKGVDIIPGPEVDIVWDLEKYPWEPFADNSIEEIYCAHYLEHTTDLMKFMDEVWRICEDGAKVVFLCPYYTSFRAWMDPTHKRVISESTFWYFNKDWREAAKISHYPIKCHFKNEKMSVSLISPWDKKPEEARKFAQEHYWNVISDIVVELKAVKF
jgi:predicted SAM-dependent methyltransferase